MNIAKFLRTPISKNIYERLIMAPLIRSTLWTFSNVQILNSFLYFTSLDLVSKNGPDEVLTNFGEISRWCKRVGKRVVWTNLLIISDNDTSTSHINVYLIWQYLIYLFPIYPFSTPWKHKKTRKVFCFQGVEKGCSRNKWVNV